MENVFNVCLGLLVFALSSFFYFVPALVAWSNKHKNVQAICVLNFFLGWTFIGWVAALIWAFTDNRVPELPVASSSETVTKAPWKPEWHSFPDVKPVKRA